MKELLKVGGELGRRDTVVLAVVGLLGFLVLWEAAVSLGWIENKFIPGSLAVIQSLPEMFTKMRLVENLIYSLKLNLMGFGVAIAISLPVGFVLGLNPLLRGLAAFAISGLPYLPLSATLVLFIGLLGIGDLMKVSFLAFAIVVYLVPVTAQSVLKTQKVYLNTAQTLGATAWQRVVKVYIPDTLARVWDDLAVLVAISWTYIIIAELINRSAGGVGSMIFAAERISRYDMMYALLFILMFVGFCQNRVFLLVGSALFPHKKAR
jgi:NitT/TauT family transport system permease protein